MAKYTRILRCCRPILWLSAIVLYMIIGGAIFQEIESKQLVDYGGVPPPVNLTAEKISLAGKYNLTSDAVNKIYDEISMVQERLRNIEDRKDEYDMQSWRFLDSCAYAMSVFTTTGYGFLYPKTVVGKLLTAIYACIGIPLFIKFVIVFGGSINCFNTCIAKRFTPADKPCHLYSRKIAFAAIEMSVMLSISASVHMVGSGWSYGESYYFSFVTLSTIGFGDMIYTLSTVRNTGCPEFQMVVSMAIILLGFSFLGALFMSIWDAVSASHNCKAKVSEEPDENKVPLA